MKMFIFAKNNINDMIAAILLGMIGTTELIVIGAVLLLFFGGRKIPELMKGLGKGVKGFKDGMKEEDPSSNSKQEEKE